MVAHVSSLTPNAMANAMPSLMQHPLTQGASLDGTSDDAGFVAPMRNQDRVDSIKVPYSHVVVVGFRTRFLSTFVRKTFNVMQANLHFHSHELKQTPASLENELVLAYLALKGLRQPLSDPQYPEVVGGAKYSIRLINDKSVSLLNILVRTDILIYELELLEIESKVTTQTIKTAVSHFRSALTRYRNVALGKADDEKDDSDQTEYNGLAL
jgi:hypothetical protein